MVGHAAFAQSCLGLPRLDATSKLVSATATGSGADRLVVGRFGVNGQRLFAGVQAGYSGRDSKFTKPSQPVIGLDVGYTFRLGARSGIELCPTLQSLYQRAPGASPGRMESYTTSLSLSMGRSVQVTPSFALVPFVQGGLLQRHTTFSATRPYDESGNQLWGSSNKLLGTAGAGLGLRLGKVLTLTPLLSMPLGAAPIDMYGNGSGFGHELFFSMSASFRIPR